MSNRQAAVNFYNQAVATINDKNNPHRLNMAYQLFTSACVADPSYGTAWFQHGNNNSDLDRVHAAIADWHMALQGELDTETRGKVWANLAWRYHNLGRTTEAIFANGKARELIPDSAHVWMNQSLIYSQRGNSRSAAECARKMLKIDPTNLELTMVLAFALLFDQQYKEGFALFEHRFQWKLQQYLRYPYPKWTGEHDGLTILLSADQGLGDTLSFARFVPEIARRSKFVHLHVQPPLLRCFMYMFSHFSNISLSPVGSPFPKADAWTTFVSLPYVLGLSDEEVKTTQFNHRINRFPVLGDWKVPGRKYHIGIAWSGSSLNPINRDRSIPFKYFYELARVPGVALYSLQMDAEGDQLTNYGGDGLVRNLKPYIGDVCDTASYLDHLDLVITCESALGHICSALGKECWIPYSYLGRDYRAGDTGDVKLWSPNHRFFQQNHKMDWQTVFDRMVEALTKRLALKEAA